MELQWLYNGFDCRELRTPFMVEKNEEDYGGKKDRKTR
jgi:hypothetical protein